ncbi:MAG: hypothetical protein HC844_05450 [Tabrizicola sp.]|nr:hypothetical protein [Tabrizicola sp.]
MSDDYRADSKTLQDLFEAELAIKRRAKKPPGPKSLFLPMVAGGVIGYGAVILRVALTHPQSPFPATAQPGQALLTAALAAMVLLPVLAIVSATLVLTTDRGRGMFYFALAGCFSMLVAFLLN